MKDSLDNKDNKITDNQNDAACSKGRSRRKEKPSEEEKPFSLIREIYEWVSVIVVAVLAALVINNFIIANTTVPTGSMNDTIMEGDRVFGSRLSYSVFGEPQRGDISIFKFGWICNHCRKAMGEGTAPEDCPRCGYAINRPKTLYYCKRLIGEPGDVIDIVAEGSTTMDRLQDLPGLDRSRTDAELITAAVYVNGEKLEEPYLKEPMLYTGEMHFEVPEGCYFFMGDNRNASLDARYWNNSYISRDKIIAKLGFRYFPNPAILK